MGDTPGSTLTLGRDDLRRSSEPTPEPVLVLVLESARPHGGSVRYRLAELTQVTLGRGTERRAELAGGELAIEVPDKWMSSRHARIEPTFGRWTFTDESKNGSMVDGHPTKRLLLEHGSVLELGHTLFVFYERLPMESSAPVVLEVTPDPDLLGAQSVWPAWQAEIARLGAIAASALPILIEGERGLGKQALARAIHERSGRQGELLQFHCGELPEHLVDGELFGDEDFEGLIRAARGGTLVLDEIADLPARSQVTLARVLHERRVVALDGARSVDVDVRVVSTTERDLDALIAAGAFRPELLAEIAGLRIVVPPLRERRADLGLLVGALHRRLYATDHPGFEIEAARNLLHYQWPLNLRELEQALAAAQVLAGTDRVRPEHLPDSVRTGRAPGTPRPLALDAAEQDLHDRLLAALRAHRGNVSMIARALDKDRKQIHRWLKRFGFDPESFR